MTEDQLINSDISCYKCGDVNDLMIQKRLKSRIVRICRKCQRERAQRYREEHKYDNMTWEEKAKIINSKVIANHA